MDDYDDTAIGQRLQIARAKAGFATATEAAKALGMKYPTYAGHENGSRGVVRGALTYSRRFRVSLDWLLAGRGLGPGETPATPEAALRSALLAYGVDGSQVDLAIALIGNLVPKVAVETPVRSPSRDQPPASSPLHAKEPSE